MNKTETGTNDHRDDESRSVESSVDAPAADDTEKTGQAAAAEHDDANDGALSEQMYKQTVSQLIRVSPSPGFSTDIESTIRRRSDGRFFGRKAFGERIPYELIAILILALGIGMYFVLRSSPTGSLRYEQNQEKPKMAPGADRVVPKPERYETVSPTRSNTTPQ